MYRTSAWLAVCGCTMAVVVSAQSLDRPPAPLATTIFRALAVEAGRAVTTQVVLDHCATAFVTIVAPADRFTSEVGAPGRGVMNAGSVTQLGGRYERVRPAPPGNGAREIYMFPCGAPGIYSVTVRSDLADGTLPAAIGVTTDSVVRAGIVALADEAVVEEPIAVTVVVREGTAPVVGATIAVTLHAPDGNSPLNVQDDGIAPDRLARDGIYTGTVRPQLAGQYTVAAHVNGSDSTGVLFERDSTTDFSASTPTATLSGAWNAAAVDDGSNGVLDGVTLTFDVRSPTRDPFQPGEYGVNVVLSAGADDTLPAIGRALLLVPGSITARVSADAVLRRGLHGSLTVRRVELVRLASTGPRVVSRLEELGNTPSFDAADFIATRVIGDLDGDGVRDCTDLELLRGLVGRRRGEPLFDTRADVSNDGVIDVRDVAAISRLTSVVCR